MRTADYGRYGNIRKEGANWLYAYTYEGTFPRDFRVKMVKPKMKVNMYTGRIKPVKYESTASQLLEETGVIYNGDFVRQKNWDYSRLYEYWKTSGKCVYLGSDELAGTRVGPSDRLDRGMVIPPIMRVGQTVKGKADFYGKGEYFGEISYSIKLLDRNPVSVGAGNFNDCIHLRIIAQAGTTRQVAEEWWAKNVGMVKRIGRQGNLERYELMGYNPKGSFLVTPGKLLLESPNSIKSGEHQMNMTFSPTAAGSSSAAEMFTISNTGSAALLISSSVELYADAFAISPIPAKKTLRPGEAITFTVRFTPKGSGGGSEYSRISIRSLGSLESIFSVELHGESLVP